MGDTAQADYYDRFHTVKKLQESINKLTNGNAPDMYGAIQKYLAIAPTNINAS